MTRKVLLTLCLMILIANIQGFLLIPKEVLRQNARKHSEENKQHIEIQKSEDYRKYNYIITTYL